MTRHPRLRSAALSTAQWLSSRHEYTVHGLEHLLETRPAIVVGYHGRFLAVDLVLLMARLYEVTGTRPEGITERFLLGVPGVGRALRGVGLHGGTDEELEQTIARRSWLFIAPGGAVEALRPNHVQHTVGWGTRRGYLKLAAKHRLPIVPVATWGADDLFGFAWHGGGIQARARLPYPPFVLKRLGIPRAIPLAQRIGPPIHLDWPDEAPTKTWLEHSHAIVKGAVQGLLEEGRRARE